MRYVLSVLWVCLAAAWLSGVSVIAHLIGGYKYIEHVGQARPVLMLSLMAICCVVSAVALILMRRLPKPLSLCVGAVAGLHGLNALGLYLLLSTNGHAPSFVMLPFRLVSLAMPTTTQFAGMPPGNASFLILPAVTLLMLLVSAAIGRGRSTSTSST